MSKTKTKKPNNKEGRVQVGKLRSQERNLEGREAEQIKGGGGARGGVSVINRTVGEEIPSRHTGEEIPQ